MTTYNTDLSTDTIGAAWASSPLGQPGEVVDPTGTYDALPEAAEPKPTARGAAFVAAMLGALAIGPLVGLAVYLYTDADAARPTAVVPGTVSAPAVPKTELTAGVPAPAGAVDPNPVVRVPERAVVRVPERVVVPPAGSGQADVGAPPVSAPGDTTVVVDIPVPPPLPPEPDPEPPPPPESEPPLAAEPEPDPEPPLPPLPDPSPELSGTPRIVDPPITTEPPSPEPSFGPRRPSLPTWDVSGLLEP
jgi:hypothetical protein